MDFVRVGYFIALNGPLNGHPPSSYYSVMAVTHQTIGEKRLHQVIKRCVFSFFDHHQKRGVSV